jgi:hypothetical protein
LIASTTGFIITFTILSQILLEIKALKFKLNEIKYRNFTQHYETQVGGGNVALDVALFIAIAEIAGIFVGFGALIGVSRPNGVPLAQLARLRGLVTMGLMIIIASLVPIAFSLYGIIDHNLWFLSSLIYYFLNWIVIILSFRDPMNRELMRTETQTNPVLSILFWLLLEVPLHVLLILNLIGVFLLLEPAFYTTALLFSLFQAAFALVQLVYSQASAQTPETASAKQNSALIIH